MNRELTFDTIPDSLIPSGRTSYRVKIGPSPALSLSQGSLHITRDQRSILLESEKHGRLSLERDESDPSRVHVTIMTGERRMGRMEANGESIVFSLESGHRLTFSRDGDRVEVRFEGFSAFDRMKLYLRRG
jgi:hypothetical protein